jgi:DNA-binding NtrC family response regulator
LRNKGVAVVGGNESSRRLVQRLAVAAGLDVFDAPPRRREAPRAVALFNITTCSEAKLEETRRLVRDLAPTPLVVLTRDCADGSCRGLRELGIAGCVPLLADEDKTIRALSATVRALEGGQGERCPRCPLGTPGETGPLCTSLLPDMLRPTWTGHDSQAPLCFPFIAAAPAMRELESRARRVAASNVTVLITGESGTGKEVLARFIHRCSNRAEGPFVKVNCAALPDPLLESELFGYEKGAFTGADSRKPGRFEIAQGGIIFLDEILELSLGLQAKLLEVLEAKSFHRLGGVASVRVDVQIIAATNRNLEKAVAAGQFRDDLYFRLKVIELTLPPLSARREDIPQLVDYFLCHISRQYSQPIPTPSPKLLHAFQHAPWPGNVRELENALRRLVILGEEGPVLAQLSRTNGRAESARNKPAEALPASIFAAPRPSFDLKAAARHAAREAERDAILTALNQTHWNRTKAARLLGVSYKTLLAKMKDLLPRGA